LILATTIATAGLIAALFVFFFAPDTAKAGTATFFGVVVVIIGAGLAYVHNIGLIDCQAQAEWAQFNSYLSILQGQDDPPAVTSPFTELDVVRPLAGMVESTVGRLRRRGSDA
jgi:hypothetical protein